MKRLTTVILVAAMFAAVTSCSAAYELTTEPSVVPSPLAEPSAVPSELFGYSDIVYTEQSVASDIGGDTEIMQVERCSWSGFRVRADLLPVDKSREYVMGKSDDSWLEGRLEKLGVDGEWEFY